MAKQKPGITWTNERRKLRDLIPWERNPRTINNAHAERLVDSVETFGQVETLAIDCRNGVLNGHQRLSVLAGQYGPDYEVDVRVANRVLTERERQQLTVYLHKGTTGHFDFEELANSFEFDDLVAWGFSEEELLGLDFGEEPTTAGTNTEPQIDKAEELRQKWGVQLGQMWACGDHRIICGDCTDAAVVARVMGGERADLCLTDPPYGIDDTQSDKNNYDQYDDTRDNLRLLIGGFLPLANSVSNCVVVTPGNGNTGMYPIPTWTMAWFTPAGVGRGPWGFCCWQPILCYGKDPKLAKGKGCHPDAIVHTESAEKLGHPCSKPIGFWEWLTERTSEKGDIVYEPFSGSGTTIIACQNLSRRCRAVEISPGYVGVALQRFLDHTGIEPVLIT